MNNLATIGHALHLAEFPSTAPSPDSSAAELLSALLAVADRVLALATDLLPAGSFTDGEALPADTAEPEHTGLYRDRDGDIWQKTERGWHLCLQRGVAVDVRSLWDWESGHVRDYGPFLPLAAN
ncbi:hypothetical protein GPX89_27490 [Nocardia sp. ET3-3]|uniref:Uncharacterized protein n=1 Tax=Nocardia terrae TaxID=2675851 RepID=A0A7K1V2W8_9NOCA|nr:hypothetical protein [Nocardia terrae]MVU80980.1 hypothetical protein [Nocardia terrae]